jgi:DNA sulfur modification protein DndE
MKSMLKATFAVAAVLSFSVTTFQGQQGLTLEDLERSGAIQGQDSLQNLGRGGSGTFLNAVNAYIYGYPLLMFGVTGRTGTTVMNPGDRLGAAPLNQFGKEPRLPDYTFTAVVLPSTTTLYASSFINLKAEPVILHIPNMEGRFFIMQMLDAWTEVSPRSPSPRLQSQPGDYALVGPDFIGTPAGSYQDIIRMPTNSMWIIGRIYTTGTDPDVLDVKTNIYPGLTLTPLSKYITPPYVAPADLPLEPMVDFITPPLNQVAGMDACAFFGAMAAMMQYNYPIPTQDDTIVQKLKAIGFVQQDMSPAYKPYDCTMATNLPTLQLAVATSRLLLAQAPTPPPTKTFWTMATTKVGTYGSDYLLRAEVAQQALGANNPLDAVYGYTQKDGRNRDLDGTRTYTIHFGPLTADDRTPPIHDGGFWSLTIYDHQGKLVANQDAINNGVKYNAIGGMMVQGHNACLNADKSLDLYLSPTAPPKGTIQFCNWLPLPNTTESFIAFLRMYWPTDAILNKDWVPPRIVRTN